jgi:hypothetical protein
MKIFRDGGLIAVIELIGLKKLFFRCGQIGGLAACS